MTLLHFCTKIKELCSFLSDSSKFTDSFTNKKAGISQKFEKQISDIPAFYQKRMRKYSISQNIFTKRSVIC
ncbi:hypothetical protein D920_01995 [Enterococcus faecalis 13-SD-W-01]|nr:hypothetical protein D920_01995 [Enterococcus faecalis 13-SD-W-01]